MKQILETGKTQSWWQDNTLILEKNQIFNLSQLLRKLDEMGYERVWQISEIGEFSQRGGVVDVFPINSNSAIRLEFFGNKIEEVFQLPQKIKDEKLAKEILKKKLKSQKLFSDLKGLKPGDYLVHLDHGVGKFVRLSEEVKVTKPVLFGVKGLNEETLNLIASRNGSRNHLSKDVTQYYLLEYAQGDKLYIPVGLERKLSRYIGFVEPKISRLGSSLWQKIKKKVREETEKLAKELLEIYAKREIATRSPYGPISEIDLQLASSFPYPETPDQAQTIQDIEKDLGKNQPMDRVVCGDVGFGKTEIALRTMVRTVNSGYQAAMICPTTILANQHFQNFKRRLKGLPIKIGMLSRLQLKKEQKETIKDLKGGLMDIVIGTHRLLSKDVEEWVSLKTHDRANKGTRGLGFLVIDDEHRFGVKQKEKLKKIRESLDILSLSATPIPRTLYMTLSSLKNISLIQTPPIGRLPVKTFTGKFSEKKVKEAIENEIKKGGQIYYLHNRIETIEKVEEFLEKLVPKIKIGIAHGRMREKELIKVMEDFSSYSYGRIRIPERSPKGGARLRYSHAKIDLLLATTIIEAGLDLPNVNTLIVDDATRLGLAEAYQIKGRIGRSFSQAFAYFFYPFRLFGKAKLRLKALKEVEELGSGYKIALRDLEIRGAGNILGKEQSGNINAVGLNLYCQILSDAVEKFKKS